MRRMRWLNNDEQRAWRAFVAMMRLLLEQLDRDLQRSGGMPLTYFEVLVHLSEAPDRTLRMSDLADRCLASRSRISHAVNRLEEMGWVHRELCPTDGRGLLAVLTEEGHEVLAAAAPGHTESVLRHLFSRLSADQVEQLRQISEAVLAPLSGPRQPAAP